MYDIPNQRSAFHNSASPLRQGSYRALAATANHFARECHIDDLAQAVGLDPLAFRLKNLTDARLRAVLEVPSAGAGETPIIAVAAAIGNAIFQASRVRLRSLPMAPDEVITLPPG